jgi:hypothetical protein
MNTEYFKKYREYEQLGIKGKAKECLANFIRSFESYEEKESWTLEYLSQLELNAHGRIRNEIFEEIVFPVLWKGYANKDIPSMIWMVRLMQNFNQNMKLWEKTGFLSDLSLIKECYEREPDNTEVIDLYLEILVETVAFRIHEWPQGVLIGNTFAERDECIKLLEEIPLLNKLDQKGKYRNLIIEYEAILNEYINE